MSVPGFPSAMSLYLSQGEKRGGANICLYLVFPLPCLYTYRKVKRGLVLTYVVTWVFLVSCVLTYRGVKEGGFNVCLYLVFALSSQGEQRWF